MAFNWEGTLPARAWGSWKFALLPCPPLGHSHTDYVFSVFIRLFISPRVGQMPAKVALLLLQLNFLARAGFFQRKESGCSGWWRGGRVTSPPPLVPSHLPQVRRARQISDGRAWSWWYHCPAIELLGQCPSWRPPAFPIAPMCRQASAPEAGQEKVGARRNTRLDWYSRFPRHVWSVGSASLVSELRGTWGCSECMWSPGRAAWPAISGRDQQPVKPASAAPFSQMKLCFEMATQFSSAFPRLAASQV